MKSKNSTKEFAKAVDVLMFFNLYVEMMDFLTLILVKQIVIKPL